MTALRNRILVGDVRRRLAELPERSVDCVITSPPYFRLRDFDAKGQLGREAHVAQWVSNLRAVAAELGRVLKPTGALWLNVGDAYSSSTKRGAPPKSLLLGPERLVLDLLSDGWLVRNKVVWAKTNPKPESVRSRLSSTWEVVYFLSRSPTAFFDLDAIRIPYRSTSQQWVAPVRGERPAHGLPRHPLGKNPGDVWPLGTASFRGAHFATFPPGLVRRPLLATCPPRVCAACGAPWEREPVRRLGQLAVKGALSPACTCRAGFRPGLVLDPFLGSGTVALEAIANKRDWLGIELNARYAQMAEARVARAYAECGIAADGRAA